MNGWAALPRRVLAAALVSACNAVACFVGRFLNGRYTEEVLWTVAEYRAASVWVCLVLVNCSVWLWLVAQRRADGLATRAAIAFVLTVPLGLELGMGIYYRRATGELSVGAALFTRAAVQLPPGDEPAQCLPIDLSDSFSWRFGEQRLRPKLLPIALEDRALRAAFEPLRCPRSR